MRKAILIYNPSSGGHSIPNHLDGIFERFQNEGILIQPYRLAFGEQDKLAKFLKQENFDYAIASGGDGTLNIVANIILDCKLNLPMGIIPLGTCNDFARCLNIPLTLKECIDVILKGRLIDVDVGLVNDKTYFLSTCAGGAFVDASYNTDSELKKNFGPFAYYLKGLTEVANIKSFKVRIKTETEIFEDNVVLMLILNGKHAGGFSNLIGEADFTDGYMDIVLIKKCTHINLANIFFKVLSRGPIDNKNVKILKAKECEIKTDKLVSMSIDGEKGDGLPAKVKFLHKALKVFI